MPTLTASPYRLTNVDDGTFLNSVSSFPFVVAQDSQVAHTDVDNILGILNGSDPAGLVTYVTPVPNRYTYLDMWHYWYSTDTSDAPTTAPVVRVYGRIPPRTVLNDNLKDIYLLNTSFPNPNTVLTNLESRGYDGHWIPLTNNNYTVGSPEVTLSGLSWRTASGSNVWGASEKFNVFLAGCNQIAVLVGTAAVLGGGSGTRESCIMGQFTS